MPFLPGDSLLFVVGALCGLGLMSLPLAMRCSCAAAVLGDQTNYTIGRRIGPRVFAWPNSRWFNRDAFDRMHAFYERYGGITIVLARFMPFLRTFAPVRRRRGADDAQQPSRFYNVAGATLWVCGLTLAGYLFGNLPWVQKNLTAIIWLMITCPGRWCCSASGRRGGQPPE